MHIYQSFTLLRLFHLFRWSQFVLIGISDEISVAVAIQKPRKLIDQLPVHYIAQHRDTRPEFVKIGTDQNDDYRYRRGQFVLKAIADT